MSETNEAPVVSRRNLLRNFGKVAVGVGAAAVGGVGASEAAREVSVAYEGLKTDVGTFFPFYEIHTDVMGVDRMPRNLDVFFRETRGVDFF